MRQLTQQRQCVDCAEVFEVVALPQGGWRNTPRCSSCREQREREISGARVSKWMEKNRAARRAYMREYMVNRRRDPVKHEKEKADKRASYSRSPEKAREASRRWAKENPLKATVQAQLRRARLASAEGSYTADEFLSLCERYGGRCFYCGVEGSLHADHIVPLARGGSNYIGNILPACKSCNSRKYTRTLEEYLVMVALAA